MLQGNSVLVMFGTFDAESIPKGWPVSVKSLDKSIAYSYNGKYAVNDADVRTEYQIVENARNNNDIDGEINYKLIARQSKSTFNVYIENVRVYIRATGSVIVNENVDKIVGQVGASSVVSDSATMATAGMQRIVQNTGTPSAAVTGSTGNVYYGGDGVVYVPAESTKPVWVTNNFFVAASFVYFPNAKVRVPSLWIILSLSFTVAHL